ncbi:MAG: FkbM family methyltransferase [Chlorobi bacterium]|nr:FkbM family methyltransferase [Chlorobiota bacterium]
MAGKRPIKKFLAFLLPYKTYLRLMNFAFFMAYRTRLLRFIKDGQYFYLINKLIKPGFICIDIGANMGHYTVLLSKLVGPQGKVYAVEPVEPVIDILKYNTKNYTNVEILPFAIGDKDGQVEMSNLAYLNKGFVSSGTHFIITDPLQKKKDVLFIVNMKKGSEVFKNLKRVDFIKCDVEGYEVNVIRELMPIIRKYKPIMLIELWKKNLDKILSPLESIGYQSFIASGHQKLLPLSDMKESFKGGDILCIHSDKLAPLLKEGEISIDVA